MSNFPFRRGACRGIPVLALLASAASAQAQATTPPARPDPLDAQARVPPATHQSALDSYRRLGEDRRIGWKEANETVNRIGGWRAYAREGQLPEPARPAPAGQAAPASSAAPAHSGHQTHGGERR